MKENEVTLENKIREALPRLKELSKGCIVKDILNEWIYEVIDNKYCPQLYSYQYSAFRSLDFKDLENIEVIGHPIKLNDVLEYFSKDNRNKYALFEVSKGKGYFLFFPNNIEEIKSFTWNLSSVFLTDQSEELKEFLNSL